jgi:hypothetical protein
MKILHMNFLFNIYLQVETFDSVMETIERDVPSVPVIAYIRQQWVPVREMWCLLGRRFYHGDHDTNNLVERLVTNDTC